MVLVWIFNADVCPNRNVENVHNRQNLIYTTHFMMCLLHRFLQYNGSVTCSEVLLCWISWKSDKQFSSRYYVI